MSRTPPPRLMTFSTASSKSALLIHSLIGIVILLSAFLQFGFTLGFASLHKPAVIAPPWMALAVVYHVVIRPISDTHLHTSYSWGSSHMTASAYCRVVISPYLSMPKCSNTSESVFPLSCAKPCRFFACVFVIVLSSS